MKKILIVIVIVFLGVGALFIGQNLLASSSDQRADAPRALATQKLDKELSFPIKDKEGKEVGKVKYLIQSIEKYDTVIVKGQKARAIKGRMFLVVNLKLTNTYGKSVDITTSDFLRLTVNDGKEKLAPDIHNDPVKVQGDSVKTTRAGFAINDTDKKIKLLFGELNGKKQEIEIKL